MTASRIAVDLPIRVKPTTTRALGTLGLGLLVALVVGSTIGSGIFGLPQNMAAGAGAILIGWTITGIPAGVRTGSRVRLAGQAEQGQNGGLAGDLYLIVKILPNAIFERDGDDLHFDVPLDIFTAIAGGEIRIPAVEKPLTLTIPPRNNAQPKFPYPRQRHAAPR